MATYSAIVYDLSSILSNMKNCYKIVPNGGNQFPFVTNAHIYKTYFGIGNPVLNPEGKEIMKYKGKTNTDKWYPVRLIDWFDSNYPRTLAPFTSVSVTYGYESAIAETPYVIVAGDWKEQGNGNYWLRIGNGEFANQGLYTIKVRTYPIAGDVVFNIEVTDFLPNETIADVPVSHQDIAQSGGISTIQLSATASVSNNFYTGSIVVIVGGLGVGQARIITNYVGIGTMATVYPNWVTNPNNTSVYKILPLGASMIDAVEPTLQSLAIDAFWDELETGHDIVNSFGQMLNNSRANIATGGALGSITLDGGASAVNDFYNGNIIFISNGLGVGQARIITAYDGATKIATVQPNWVTNPGAASEYVIIPSSSSSVSVPAIANAILDADLQLHLGLGVGGRNIGNILGQLAQSEFENATSVFAAGPIPAQNITLQMAARGCIQYQKIDVSYTKTWGAPDRTYYLLWHYDAQQRVDQRKPSDLPVW